MKYWRMPPAATVDRMARYLNYLTSLPPDQLRVSSKQISLALGIKPTQFRQDFHYFGGFGQPGRGYDKQILIRVLEKILGVDHILNMVIIGVGHLGTALAKYPHFERFNLRLVGLFDRNPRIIGSTMRGIQIMHPDELTQFAHRQMVNLAVITTDAASAYETCQRIIQAGIKGVWNFTSVRLTAPSGFVVRNEQPALGLLALTFRLNELEHLAQPNDFARQLEPLE